MGLVVVPLIGGLILVEHRLGVRAMADHGDQRHQHGYKAHGEGHRAQQTLTRGVFGVFLQLLGFVGFHEMNLPSLGWLFPLPVCAVLGVFDHDAFFGEFVADLIGAGEVALLFGLRAFGHQSLDGLIGQPLRGQQLGSHIGGAALALGPLDGAARDFGVAVLDHVEEDSPLLRSEDVGAQVVQHQQA